MTNNSDIGLDDSLPMRRHGPGEALCVQFVPKTEATPALARGDRAGRLVATHNKTTAYWFLKSIQFFAPAVADGTLFARFGLSDFSKQIWRETWVKG